MIASKGSGMKSVSLIFALLIFSCQQASNLPLTEKRLTTNNVKMVYSIEKEKFSDYTLYYIDGQIEGVEDIKSVKLFYNDSFNKNKGMVIGTYNGGRFSFTLFLDKGNYKLDVVVEDTDTNIYIEKDINIIVN